MCGRQRTCTTCCRSLLLLVFLQDQNTRETSLDKGCSRRLPQVPVALETPGCQWSLQAAFPVGSACVQGAWSYPVLAIGHHAKREPMRSRETTVLACRM